MSDLISRQALCDDLREYKVHPVPVSSDESEVKGYNDGIDLAISVIAEFPSAEPEERTAKVLKLSEGFYFAHGVCMCGHCDQCGNTVCDDFHWCPFCGARLEWE